MEMQEKGRTVRGGPAWDEWKSQDALNVAGLRALARRGDGDLVARTVDFITALGRERLTGFGRLQGGGCAALFGAEQRGLVVAHIVDEEQAVVLAAELLVGLDRRRQLDGRGVGELLGQWVGRAAHDFRLVILVAGGQQAKARGGDQGDVKFHSDPFMCVCSMMRQRKTTAFPPCVSYDVMPHCCQWGVRTIGRMPDCPLRA